MVCSGPSPPPKRSRRVSPRTADGLIVAILLGPWAAVASAQTTALDCIPPPLPYADLPAGVVDAYRDQLRLDYSECFDAAQRYLQCLARAEATARTEIDTAVADYTRRLGDGDN
ncbi:hypothetical protein ATO3_27800 [Marinibacterium profundimaris]|uniref:Uncharacterized protein n=1 Tax=Marinibacterium profundimaris TaxID=1679460 RepID=A0A225NAT2_9RHOB|nr:hypothetical protein ATO3_27800 [Marinibacterium profundimaris]